MNKVTGKGFLSYFTGKGMENAKWAAQIINKSIEEDGWIKGTSRTVHAALTKFNTATKNQARWFDGLSDARPYDHGTEDERVKPLRHALWEIGHRMYFGGPVDRMAEACSVLEAASDILTSDEKKGLSIAKSFVADFAAIWAAVKYLDGLRPKPVFVLKTLSPTGAKLLLDAGYKPDTCRLPEFRYFRDAEGRPEMEIVWPEGTKHGKSRFYRGTAQNFQCHACGHAIKNMSNWVPLAIDNANGEVHSFWVGRDCAKKLFGVDMKGDASYKNTEGR